GMRSETHTECGLNSRKNSKSLGNPTCNSNTSSSGDGNEHSHVTLLEDDDVLERLSIQQEREAPVQAFEIRREYASVTPPHSFVTRYVDYARRRTDAPLEAHELMALGLLSA